MMHRERSSRHSPFLFPSSKGNIRFGGVPNTLWTETLVRNSKRLRTITTSFFQKEGIHHLTLFFGVQNSILWSVGIPNSTKWGKTNERSQISMRQSLSGGRHDTVWRYKVKRIDIWRRQERFDTNTSRPFLLYPVLLKIMYDSLQRVSNIEVYESESCEAPWLFCMKEWSGHYCHWTNKIVLIEYQRAASFQSVVFPCILCIWSNWAFEGTASYTRNAATPTKVMTALAWNANEK